MWPWSSSSAKESLKKGFIVFHTLCERCGFGHWNAIKGTHVPTGVKGHDPSPILDQAVLCFDAWAVYGDVLRHGGILTADAGHA